MADQYYTREETVKKLALKPDELDALVKDGRLREFRIDGEPKYKVSEVDKLAEELNPPIDLASTDVSGSGIELVADGTADSETDIIPLEDTSVAQKGKDTVIKPAGVSVFDEDELSGLETDPMAKTQIAHSVTDELSLEGGRSGILDMARESDDTSLGADLLDEIAVEGSTAGAAVAGGVLAEEQPLEVGGGAEYPAAARMMVEVRDPLVGLFSGLIIAAAILLGVSGLVVVGLFAGVLPGIVEFFASNMLYTIIAVVAIVVVSSVVGFLTNK